METKEEQRAVTRIVETLTAEFPRLPSEHVASLVRESHRDFAGRPVRDYIPVLVAKNVRKHLRQATQTAPGTGAGV